ncbi:hypothetical protein GPJ56_002109 [Histomonas meleagridis]|nr:hypothetical protein GPJ56_002109 [Histomonas meleagridis]
MVSAHFGISGLPNFYENQITGTTLTLEDQIEISQLSDPLLLQFYSTNVEQNQYIDFSFGSMNQWIATPDSINLAIETLSSNTTNVTPFGTLSFTFKYATTSNKAQSVVLNIFSQKLTEEQKLNLTKALSNDGDDQIIFIKNFIPMFITIPYDSLATYVDKYYYDATFKMQYENNEKYWELSTSINRTDLPKMFLNRDNKTRIVVWSQPVLDALLGSILSNAGGTIIGLYAFIIVTIGHSFVTKWVADLFTTLWVSRMHDPMKILNILMAIDAYQMSNDLDNEFKLAEMLLENLRSTQRVIQLTDITRNKQNDDGNDPMNMV